MEVKLDPATQKRYKRLLVSSYDLSTAGYCLDTIIKKGWHHEPWERRGSIYQQQTVFTTTMVVAYARPFNSRPKLALTEITLTDAEYRLHLEIMTLRNKVCAHSDQDVYSVTPWRSKKLATDIVSVPTVRITAEQAYALKIIIGKFGVFIRTKLNELVPQ